MDNFERYGEVRMMFIVRCVVYFFAAGFFIFLVSFSRGIEGYEIFIDGFYKLSIMVGLIFMFFGKPNPVRWFTDDWDGSYDNPFDIGLFLLIFGIGVRLFLVNC